MLLNVARIGRPHGVRGEVTIEVRTDSPEKRFAPGSKLTTESGKFGPLTIESVRNNNGTLLIKFVEISDRNQAEELKNQILVAEIDLSKESGENEFHLQQILGSGAFLENGEKVGTIIDVVHIPGQDLLVIDHNGREVLIPFVSEIVPDIDIENRKITISEKEGLFDE